VHYLKKFIALDPRFKNAEIINANGGVCPVSGVFEKIVDDGVMLVGDAAGMMVPMTGAGIHTGVAAGKIAGEVAAHAVHSGDVSGGVLEEYVKRFDADWGSRIRDAGKMLRMFDKFNDEHFNTIAEVIEPDDIINLTNGLNVKRTVARIIARSPRSIIGLMSAYLL
jgi:digeranylgeranylglycerophospholipid reductase